MSDDPDNKPGDAEDAFEKRVASIVSKLVERNSLSNREARAVQSEADKLLNAVQDVIDSRVKFHTDQVKLALKVAAGCFAIFAILLIPEETRKAIGRMLVPDERIQAESMKSLNEIESANLSNLRTYIEQSSEKSLPSAFEKMAHVDQAEMLSRTLTEQAVGRRLISYYSEVEGTRLARQAASPQVVVQYGHEPRHFDAVQIGENHLDGISICGEKISPNEAVAVIATPLPKLGENPALGYFWFGCPGAYPITWVRIDNPKGQSELIRVVGVERGTARTESGRPEIRLTYGALRAAEPLALPNNSRSTVRVRVVKACPFETIGQASATGCEFEGANGKRDASGS